MKNYQVIKHNNERGDWVILDKELNEDDANAYINDYYRESIRRDDHGNNYCDYSFTAELMDNEDDS